MTLHEDEIPIDARLVRTLIDAQFPQYAQLALRRLDETGSTNALFRLGDELLVRLPLQPGNGAAIEAEQRWSDVFRSRMPVAIPRTLAVGRPGSGYPERWSILGWLPGERPSAYQPGQVAAPPRSRLAAELAVVIQAIRSAPLTAGDIRDPSLRGYRGGTLAEFDRSVRGYLDDCRGNPELDVDLDLAQQIWEAALRLPGADRAAADQWYHGDLVAENLLVSRGGLSAVVDFGVSVGDPTIDLHGAWELFDPPAREIFRDRLDADEATWLRGRAWALGIALGTFSYYWRTLPSRCADRLAMIRNVLADAS